MLAVFDRYLQVLREAQSDADIVRILADAARMFGFRSAYLIEYVSKLSDAQHVYDTDPARQLWWGEYFAGDLRPSAREVQALMSGEPILRSDITRFGPETARLRAACERHDVVDVLSVPISDEGELVGVAGFCGEPDLDRQQQMALQLIAYTVFAQIRIIRDAGPRPAPVVPLSSPADKDTLLTPREKEVVRLSAEGLTSQEIAKQLGMSTRTANQHFDNVAEKLGTKNRAHTVAEVIRHRLID